MRVYVIDVAGAKRFAGSQSEATAARNELLTKYLVKKSAAGDAISTMELGTNKADLLAYLNELAEHFDPPAEAAG